MIDDEITNDTQLIWIEKMGIGLLCFSVIKIITGKAKVYYNSHALSLFSKFSINLLKKTIIGNKLSDVFSLRAYNEIDGTTLYYRIDRNLRACVNTFCAMYVPHETLGYQNMVKCYLAKSLHAKMTLATIAESIVASGPSTLKKYMYFDWHPHNTVITSYLESKGFIANSSINLNNFLRYLLKPIYYLIFISVTRFCNKNVKTNISEIRPSVWVQYADHDMLDFLFWRDHTSNFEGIDSVCYLDRPDSPPNSRVVSEIERKYQNIRWIDANIFTLIKATDFTRDNIRNLLKPLLSYNFPCPMFYRAFQFEYLFLSHIYTSIFTRFKVKILIQHLDASWTQEVQARAVERAGGIMIGFHWSNYTRVMTPFHLFPFHVFFVWSKFFYEIVNKGAATCDYMLPSGLWIMASERTPVLPQLTARCKFVMAIFDSSVTYSIIYQVPDTLEEFYLRLINLLEMNALWGAVLKSKNWELDGLKTLPKGEMIIRRLATLVAAGRVVILDHTLPPMIAANQAHLSVCYSINSAGIISGIYGHRVVHWDCAGWTKNPFYKDPDQKFIFKTLDDLECAIKQAADGDKSVGDFSQWRERMNHFDDTKAPERVGRFIQDFMGSVVETGDRERALSLAAEKYLADNSIYEDFYKIEHWWGGE